LYELIKKSRPQDFYDRYPNYRAEDEELFFEENLTKAYFEKHLFDLTKLEGLHKAQQAFKTALSRQGIQLHPYYALVAFDIDGLGRYLQHLNESDKHEETASKLHEFAITVKGLVGSDKGEILHAGGDDFLLMLNLKGLFDTLKNIQQAWLSLNTSLTYSTSVLIGHYKSPLTRAVKTVKAELKAVKTRFKSEGKNGLSFCFMAKSGAVNTSYFKQDKLQLLHDLLEALQTGEYSPKFIFLFARNMEVMGFDGATTSDEQETLRAFALSELQRLMFRARGTQKDDATQDTQKVCKAATAVQFSNQFSAILAEQVRDGGTLLDLTNFIQFLKMAELAAKHTNEWPKDTSK
jgi:CRISPR-associated protein Cmr2